MCERSTLNVRRGKVGPLFLVTDELRAITHQSGGNDVKSAAAFDDEWFGAGEECRFLTGAVHRFIDEPELLITVWAPGSWHHHPDCSGEHHEASLDSPEPPAIRRNLEAMSGPNLTESQIGTLKKNCIH